MSNLKENSLRNEVDRVVSMYPSIENFSSDNFSQIKLDSSVTEIIQNTVESLESIDVSNTRLLLDDLEKIRETEPNPSSIRQLCYTLSLSIMTEHNYTPEVLVKFMLSQSSDIRIHVLDRLERKLKGAFKILSEDFGREVRLASSLREDVDDIKDCLGLLKKWYALYFFIETVLVPRFQKSSEKVVLYKTKVKSKK